MKFALVTTPAVALLGLALLVIPTTRCDAVLVVKSSNASASIDILGEHQPLERTWTIYSSSALEGLTFQGAGNIFVGFDAELKTDPVPAVLEPVHAPTNKHLGKPSPAHQPSHASPPDSPNMPDMPDLPDLPDLPNPPSPSSLPFELLYAADGSLSDANDTQPVAPVASPLQAVAKIVVSGDNEALLNTHSVVVTTSGDGSALEIALSAGKSTHGGYVLTQLFVVKQSALSKVSAISSGDIVISEGVLVTHDSNATVTLSSIGSGDIFVASNETLAVRSLELQTAGSGNVQLQFATVRVADAISLSGVASGDIALLADNITAQHIATTVVGSSDLFVQATDSVTTTTLETFVGGSGAVTVSHDGACVNQSITIAGSGDVRTGSIACENVDVNIFGSGDALVQAKQSLAVTLVASGRVTYVTPAPQQVVIKGSIFRKHLAQRVQAAKANKFKVYKPKRVPVRTPEFVHRTKHHRFTWWGLFGDDDDSDDDSDDSSDSSDAAPPSHSDERHHHHFRLVINDGSPSGEIVIDGGDDDNDESKEFPQPVRFAAMSPGARRGPSAVMMISVVGVAMGIVGVAAYKFKQRRARQQYRPLF